MKKILIAVAVVIAVIAVVIYLRQPAEPPAELGPAEPAVEQPAAPVQRLKQPSAAQRERLESVIGQPVSIRHMTLITDFRSEKKVGDVVRFEAKPMGSMTPFMAKEASFIVGDELTVASCDLLSIQPRCPTPWDTHIEEPEAIAAGTVEIRIVDDVGEVIPASAKGINGLKELRRLRISGTIVEMEPGEYPVVHADAIQFLD